MIVAIILVFFVLFAFKYELRDAPNTYNGYRPRKTDTTNVTIRKLEGLINCQKKAIRWRRAFIPSVCIAFLVPLVVYQQFPSGRELLVITSIAYVLILLQWTDYTETTTGYISEYARTHCTRLRKNLAVM